MLRIIKSRRMARTRPVDDEVELLVGDALWDVRAVEARVVHQAVRIREPKPMTYTQRNKTHLTLTDDIN